MEDCKRAGRSVKNMDIDPQLVNIGGSIVINLPSNFEDGKRLGHNWSLEMGI